MCSFSSHFLLRFSTARARSLRTSNQNQVRTKSCHPQEARRNRKKTQEVAPQAEADVECLHQPLAQVDQQPYVDVRRTMKIVNSFVNDLFERIASEAATVVRVNKKRTLVHASCRRRCPRAAATWRSTQWRRAPRRCRTPLV
ncbi:histone H2B [Trypanosoma cruzi cruzi]|nr:histone H2B [Trypanosoma cruzi cruzi]